MGGGGRGKEGGDRWRKKKHTQKMQNTERCITQNDVWAKQGKRTVTMRNRDTWDKWWGTKKWNEHLDWPQGAWPVAGGGPEGGGGGVGIRWNRWQYHHHKGLQSPAQSPRPPLPGGAQQVERCGGWGRGAHLWGWHHRGWVTWGDS